MANKTIQEILASKVKKGSFALGDKLYSPLSGECILRNVSRSDSIILEQPSFKSVGNSFILQSDGRVTPCGECMVYPSAKMRNWNKFSWEKYTLVCHSKNRVCFFKDWASQDYTDFYGLEYEYSDGTIKEKVKKYRTRDFSTCKHNQEVKYYKELYYQCNNHSIATLMENCSLYNKVIELIKQEEKRSEAAVEKRDKENREGLEVMTRRSILTDDYVKENLPVKGKLFHFTIEDKTYLGVFNRLSEDQKTAFFLDIAVLCDFDSYFVHIEVETKRCVDFRVATKEEVVLHKRVLQKRSIVLLHSLVMGEVYAFIGKDDGLPYVGKVLSEDDHKATIKFENLICFRKDTISLDQEKSFLNIECVNLHVAYNEELEEYQHQLKQVEEKSRLYSFRRFQWCLMRDDEDLAWDLCQFAYKSANGHYVSVGGYSYEYCIPYDGNENLLGTKNKPADGEE